MFPSKRILRNIAFALSSSFIGVATVSSYAQSVVEQAGDNPVSINQSSGQDNVVMLTAASAEHLDDMSVVSSPRPKHGYVTGFENASQYFKWRVSVSSNATYNMLFQMNPGDDNQTFSVQVDSGATTQFTVDDNGWARVEAGAINLSSGTHDITLRRSTLSGTAEFKSLELMRSDLQSAYDSRVASYRSAASATTANLSAQPYGIMFQYGPWGYPVSGTDKKSIDDQAADFDVAAFVDMIKSTGGSYVIWSASWWTYEISAPIQAVDNIVGHGGRTSQRDLIGDVAQALADEGIDFYLYYHTGQDSHLGYGSTDWWQAQSWPNSFSTNGLDEREVFFTNWKAVISEIGNRYGSLLKGWFFDDGRMYYPAKLEELAAAARAGNAARVISYNNANAALITDFQDVSFGETCRSDDADQGGDGKYVRGAETGVQGHCMYKLDSAWGVANPNDTSSTRYSIDSAFSLVATNSARGVPTTFDIMMWEDGTVWASTLEVLQGLNELMGGCGVYCERLNNTDLSINYTGTWGLSSNRKNGDYQADVQYTSVNGDSASLTFTGTEVRLYMPTYGSYGNFEVLIDGVSQGIHSANSTSGYTAQVNTFSVAGLVSGEHTVQIVKIDGGYMQLDFIEVVNEPADACTSNCTQLNNANSAFNYTGSWATSSGRGAGDFSDDVAYTTVNGDSVSLSFTGTEVRVFMPTYGSYGDFEVFIDGTSQGTYSAYSADGYTAQVNTFTMAGLSSATHTLELVKQNGNYMQLDYVEVVDDPESGCGTYCERLNNTDSIINYVGSWGLSSNRKVDDYEADVQYTTVNGDSANITFIGTGIRLFMPTYGSYGDFEVIVDGVSQGTYSANSDSGYTPQVNTYSITGMSADTHTIEIIKVNGGYMQLDYIEVIEY